MPCSPPTQVHTYTWESCNQSVISCWWLGSFSRSCAGRPYQQLFREKECFIFMFMARISSISYWDFHSCKLGKRAGLVLMSSSLLVGLLHSYCCLTCWSLLALGNAQWVKTQGCHINLYQPMVAAKSMWAGSCWWTTDPKKQRPEGKPTSKLHLNSPCGDNSFHFVSNVSCPFKSGLSGDFQLATSPRETYLRNNSKHCASWIMSIVITPAEAQEES